MNTIAARLRPAVLDNYNCQEASVAPLLAKARADLLVNEVYFGGPGTPLSPNVD